MVGVYLPTPGVGHEGPDKERVLLSENNRPSSSSQQVASVAPLVMPNANCSSNEFYIFLVSVDINNGCMKKRR